MLKGNIENNTIVARSNYFNLNFKMLFKYFKKIEFVKF
jgi:hypothetical protein